MSKERRFYYVTAPGGDVVHLHWGKLLEGEKLACGRRLQKGWHWVTRRPSMKRCSGCHRLLK
jgi:ribosomal protein L34E